MGKLKVPQMGAPDTSTIAVLAEKPSVARDIARVLGANKQGDGYLQANGYVVTWAVGHLAALAQPHEINPEWRRWRSDLLPMLPEEASSVAAAISAVLARVAIRSMTSCHFRVLGNLPSRICPIRYSVYLDSRRKLLRFLSHPIRKRSNRKDVQLFRHNLLPLARKSCTRP